MNIQDFIIIGVPVTPTTMIDPDEKGASLGNTCERVGCSRLPVRGSGFRVQGPGFSDSQVQGPGSRTGRLARKHLREGLMFSIYIVY